MMEASKAFFSEEKKQKTFAPCRRLRRGPRQPDKSFLLLFLEKEGLFAFRSPA